MPVTLDLLSRTPLSDLPETDAPDLARLAQDMSACPCYQSAWIAWQASAPGVRLHAARFNGRIVGVVFVEGECVLSLGVRALTRGRGVGRRMVSVLAQQHPLCLSAQIHPELGAFVSACLASLADRK